jgi:putative tricarboxylic transport membrane protein
MNKVETLAAGAILAVGMLMLYYASHLPYMLDGVPGPGFLPLWIAIGIVVTAILLIVQAVRARSVPQEPIEWPTAAGWRRVLILLAALAAALWLLDWLGFMIVATLFMLVVVVSLGVRSWGTLVSVPLLAAIGLYVVFAVWLRVPLPKGLLNFLE